VSIEPGPWRRKRQNRSLYLSYLLRLWQTPDGDRQVWRFSLQSPGTDEWRGFANLEELVAFLRELVDTEGGESSVEKGRT